MTLSKDEMIAYISEEWVDGIDIKDYLRAMLIDFTDELQGWPEEQIIQEYKQLTES